MCGVAAAGLIISAVSAGVSAYSQKQTADAQTDANYKQYEAQREELSAKADEEAGQRVKQMRAERARMKVASGEAGISGASFEAQLANNFGLVNQELAVASKQGYFNSRALSAQYRSAQASIDRPTVLSSGLQIAGGAANGYSMGLGIAAQRKAAADADAATRNART